MNPRHGTVRVVKLGQSDRQGVGVSEIVRIDADELDLAAFDPLEKEVDDGCVGARRGGERQDAEREDTG
jgi:hypothetical protein